MAVSDYRIFLFLIFRFIMVSRLICLLFFQGFFHSFFTMLYHLNWS